eukprot:1602825-Rhodomonas_salina.1
MNGRLVVRKLCLLLPIFLVCAARQNPFAPDQGIYLHQLKGRPVMVHSNAHIHLQPVEKSTLNREPRRRRTDDEDRQQYLIRIQEPKSTTLIHTLFAEVGREHVKYIPHDAYIVTMSRGSDSLSSLNAYAMRCSELTARSAAIRCSTKNH